MIYMFDLIFKNWLIKKSIIGILKINRFEIMIKPCKYLYYMMEILTVTYNVFFKETTEGKHSIAYCKRIHRVYIYVYKSYII